MTIPPIVTALASIAVTAGSLSFASSATASDLIRPAADVGCPTASAPTLTSGVYSVDDSSHLQWVKVTTAAWDDSFIQTADIDMGGCVWDGGIGGTFTGIYDGGGHEITALDVNSSSSNGVGLFDNLEGTVKNLGYTGDVTSTNTSSGLPPVYVGALVGYVDEGGAVLDSYATGDVQSAYTDQNYCGTGGLIGAVRIGSITGSFATGDVSATYAAGGLVGRALNSRTPSLVVDTSFATGNVTVSKSSAGGFAGYLMNATVTRSYSTGNVSSTSLDDTPGTVVHLAGFSGVIGNSQISDAYSTGGVVGGNEQLGGFGGDVGSGLGSVTLTRVYSVTATGMSPVNATSESGGFIGYRGPEAASTGAVTDALWNNETSMFTDDSSVGLGSTTGIKGRSTTELKTLLTYTDDTAGWDWNSAGNIISSGYNPNYTWGICAAVNNGYPFLTGTYSVNPCASAPTVPQNVVATGGNASATVTWAAPVSDGGSALTGYTVTASPGGQTCTDDTVAPLSCVVSGLTNGTSYTFDVTATNGVGTSLAATSNAVTPSDPTPPPVFPPSEPLNVLGVAGDASAVISWSPPASSGSFAVTDYQAVASPGGQTCVAAAPATTCTLTGLTNGEPYTVIVRALNGAGWGAWSSPSASFTPVAPVTKAIVITGSRAEVKGRTGVRAFGETTGLEGARLQARVHLAGEIDYYDGSQRTVGADGSFTWQRVTNKKVYVYFRTLDDRVRSNRIIITIR